MTEADRGAFGVMMLGLGEAYSEPVSDARLELYFAALADLPLDAIRRAATTHVRAARFFPRVAEIREAVHGSLDDAAELAWLELLRLVRRFGYWTVPPDSAWGDQAARRAAMELYGGWRPLCERLPGEGPGLAVAAKAFKAAYASHARQGQRGELVAPALFELTDGRSA